MTTITKTNLKSYQNIIQIQWQQQSINLLQQSNSITAKTTNQHQQGICHITTVCNIVTYTIAQQHITNISTKKEHSNIKKQYHNRQISTTNK